MANYKPDPRGTKALASSPGMRRALRRIAERRGVPAFQAAAPVRTGAFRRNVRVEDGGTTPDGLAVVRIVAYGGAGNAPLPIEFGAEGRRGANALQTAVNAIEGRR